MATTTTTVCATQCPLCGQANQCAMEVEQATGVPQPPCWCTQAAFGADLLARVAPAASGKSCICAACAQAAQSEGAALKAARP